SGRPEGLRYILPVSRPPAPCTLHPAPCTLHPAPCTLHPALCTLLLNQFFYFVHDAIHLPDREIERLARRHVNAGALQQIDRILRPTRREERTVVRDRIGRARQHFLRERRG